MFVINEDKSIYITRGDVAFFSVEAKTDTGETYKFQAGDVVRFKVFEKKACDNVVLQKDFGIEAETDEVGIYLEKKDTKFGDVISKPTDYWYEVELNPYTDAQTLIGYDEDGAKVFKLFPEGSEAEDNDPITPEDIPVVDEDLDLTSTRPVQNQAIARAILKINEDVQARIDGLEIEVGEGLRNAGGNNVINVADPTEDDDAANKRYVDSKVESLDVDGKLESLDAESKRYVDDTLETFGEESRAYAQDTFVPREYEDITDSFILIPEGSMTLPTITEISVLKRDREIKGFIEFEVTSGMSGLLCYVNRDYLPAHTVIVDALAVNAEDVPLDGYIPVVLKYKYMPNQIACLKPALLAGASRMILNFSYICKED